MNTSALFTLNWNDYGKGLIVAVAGAVLTAVQNVVSAGSLDFNWKQIGTVAATTGIAYLLKNLFTPAKVVSPAE